MKIEQVDFFYLKMPEILDIGDGSQDALLVRIRGGGLEGWGECEASPLTSIASYVCPMSHSACKPLNYELVGSRLDSVEDIRQISARVHAHSSDLLQADHTLSGIDIALWDLLGKKLQESVYRLLGDRKAFRKLPYGSQLFGDSPEETYEKAKKSREEGFRAVKFGWGSFGKEGLEADAQQLMAAREGLGEEALLMVDAGTAWNDDLEEARKRLSVLDQVKAYWLEEPFVNGETDQYRALASSSPYIPLAGGEGCNNVIQAKQMLTYGGLSFVQIDAGRIGGITAARQVVDMAREKKITYVNHTFTSHLALSASLQAFVGSEENPISEYPVELKSLAREITTSHIKPDDEGYIHIPEAAGLGVTVDTQAIRKYLVDVEIKVNQQSIYYTPEL